MEHIYTKEEAIFLDLLLDQTRNDIPDLITLRGTEKLNSVYEEFRILSNLESIETYKIGKGLEFLTKLGMLVEFSQSHKLTHVGNSIKRNGGFKEMFRLQEKRLKEEKEMKALQVEANKSSIFKNKVSIVVSVVALVLSLISISIAIIKSQ